MVGGGGGRVQQRVMTNPYENHRSHEEEASPSMSRNAEDNLSNSDGPLLVVKKRDKDLTPARCV